LNTNRNFIAEQAKPGCFRISKIVVMALQLEKIKIKGYIQAKRNQEAGCSQSSLLSV
jgi:hypothetical protein